MVIAARLRFHVGPLTDRRITTGLWTLQQATPFLTFPAVSVSVTVSVAVAVTVSMAVAVSSISMTVGLMVSVTLPRACESTLAEGLWGGPF